jgi:VWFA-related protein
MKTRWVLASALLGSLLAAPMAYGTESVSAEALAATTKSSVEEVATVTANAQDSGLYADGTRAINEGRWSDAVTIFTKVAGEQGEHADGALYWKAYAENKQGQPSRALNTCDELRRAHPKSRWMDECGALEIEIRAQSGQPIQPQVEQDENLKLLALNSLMKQDELRALPEIQQILNGDLPEKFKERALFVLAQGQSKQAQELLEQIAQGHSNTALQAKAAEMLAKSRDKQSGPLSLATGDTQKPDIHSFVRSEAAGMSAKRDDKLDGSPSPGSGTASRAIILDVVVTDKSGRPVAGLQPQDFTLFDNKQPRNILSFYSADGIAAKADGPALAFLLVDEINSSFNSIANTRQQLVKYLQQNGGHLAVPMSFIFLTDTRAEVQNQSTRDGNALIAYLDDDATRLLGPRRLGGLYNAEERWQRSLRALDLLSAVMSKRPGRKLIIWISPGWPAFSGFEWLKTQKDRQGLFDYVAGISTALREARITLCSVDPQGVPRGEFNERNFLYRDFLKGVASAKQVDHGDLFLQVLATQTGGQVLFGSYDIASLIDRCAADANAYYVLSFNPPPASHPNEYRGIEIQINKPGLKARTRTGYYAQP